MLDPWFHIGHPFKYLKKRIYWALAERRALLGAQRVLFTTKEEQKLALTSMPSSNYMSEVVPYGIRPPKKMSFNKEDFYSLFPSAQGKKILLFMSRLHPKKGCDLLLKAFSKMRNTENVFLIMAGPDQVAWKKELLLLAERLRINDSVAWPGMLEGELKELTLHFADAFILPSHQENFGISVAEALAREIPVLISTKVNIWREVVESDAGWAAEDTEEGCLHLLNLWVEEENIHKKRLSAKLCFDKNFNLDLNAHKLEETLTLRSV
jgi:glycosyltransferase involved in cell wall biosynthesis